MRTEPCMYEWRCVEGERCCEWMDWLVDICAGVAADSRPERPLPRWFFPPPLLLGPSCSLLDPEEQRQVKTELRLCALWIKWCDPIHPESVIRNFFVSAKFFVYTLDYTLGLDLKYGPVWYGLNANRSSVSSSMGLAKLLVEGGKKAKNESFTQRRSFQKTTFFENFTKKNRTRKNQLLFFNVITVSLFWARDTHTDAQ